MDPLASITPGPAEWLLILVIVLVLFGAKKLPGLAHGLGQGNNEFRKARDDSDRSLGGAEPAARQSPAPAGIAPDVSATRDGACRPEASAEGVGCNDPSGPTTAAATIISVRNSDRELVVYLPWRS